MLNILVVEDSPQYRKRLCRLLTETLSGYEINAVGSRDEALSALVACRPDVVLLDLIIPSRPGSVDVATKHGESLLKASKSACPDTKVIVISTEGDLVRDFLREKGADDFFTKDRKGDWEHEKLPAQLEEMVGHLVCRSDAMQALREELARIGQRPPALVLEGALGSGKEYVASILHRCSGTSSRPFRRYSIAALATAGLTETLTGELASPRSTTTVPRAGTLLLAGLEHAALLPPAAQAQFAAIVSSIREQAGSQEVQRTPETSPPQLVVTSTRSLGELAGSGELTAELHSALARGPVLRLPAPQERLADLEELLQVFRRRANATRETTVRRIDGAVVEVIAALLRTAPPPDGWDTVARLVEEAVARADGEVLLASHLRVEGLPEQYRFVWVSDGVVHRERGSEADLATLSARAWPLTMRAAADETGPFIREATVESQTVDLDDRRLGRILYLLASRPGEVVEVARHKRALDLPLSAQTKRFIRLLRQALHDTDVSERTSRFFASRYSEAYEFRTETDFLLIEDLPST